MAVKNESTAVCQVGDDRFLKGGESDALMGDLQLGLQLMRSTFPLRGDW